MKVIKAFLAGITLGILFAPQSGRKTRRRLRKIFADAKNNVRDHVADAVGTVESTAHSAKKSIKQM